MRYLVIAFIVLRCGTPAVQPTTNISCVDIQKHIEKIGCIDMTKIPGDDDIIDTEDDPTFVQWCEWIKDSGIKIVDWNCVINSQSCIGIEKCFSAE